MSRLDGLFARLRARQEAALLPYLTVGYPSAAQTVPLGLELLRAGADGLELGIPFSDPLADGVTLQAVSQRVLVAGGTVEDAFRAARALRARTEAPLVFMSYYNPVQRRGTGAFCEAAAASGADGLIVPDLPPEEARPLREACRTSGLALIPMVAPGTPPERLRAACADAEGFVYCVALQGVTGARSDLAGDLPAFLERVRACTTAPLVVGFGISRPEHVASVRRYADGVIVASALVDLLERTSEPERLAAAARYVGSLKAAARPEDARPRSLSD
jgi:tryptophan synthase alpha chain